MKIFNDEIFKKLSDPSIINIGDRIEYQLLTTVQHNTIGSGLVTEINNFDSAKTYFLIDEAWINHKRVVVRKTYNKRQIN